MDILSGAESNLVVWSVLFLAILAVNIILDAINGDKPKTLKEYEKWMLLKQIHKNKN